MHQISCFFLLCLFLLIDNSLTLSAQKMVYALARTQNPDFHSFFRTDLHQQCHHLKLINIFYEGLNSYSEYFQPRTSAASIFSLSNISPSIFVFKKTSFSIHSLILRSQNSSRLLDFTPNNSSLESCSIRNLFHRFSKSSKYMVPFQIISQHNISINSNQFFTARFNQLLLQHSFHQLQHSSNQLQFSRNQLQFFIYQISLNQLQFLIFRSANQLQFLFIRSANQLRFFIYPISRNQLQFFIYPISLEV